MVIASSTQGFDKCVISSSCTLPKSPKCSHVAARSLNQEQTFRRARPFSSLQHNSRILHPPPHKNQSSFRFSYFIRRYKDLCYTVVCVCKYGNYFMRKVALVVRLCGYSHSVCHRFCLQFFIWMET